MTSGKPGHEDDLRRRAEQEARAQAVPTPDPLAVLSPEAARQALHDLRVHQIELEMQNEELRRTQAALDASRERYFDLYDLAPVGYATLGEAGLILEANLTAAMLLGVPRGALVDQPITRFIHHEDQDTYYLHRKQLLATGEPQACDLRMVREDGALFWVHLAAAAAEDAGGARVCRVVLSNITDRKFQEYEREMTADLALLVVTPAGFREHVVNLTGALQRWSGCEAVGIRLRAGDDYPYYETRGFPAAFVHQERHLCSYGPNGELERDESGSPVLDCMCGNILRGRFNPAEPCFTPHGSFWSNNTTAQLAGSTEAGLRGRTRNHCNSEGYESVALVPLRAEHQVFGLLQFNDHRPDRFTPGLIAHFERMADSLAIALSRRQTEEALRESEALYRGLFEHMAEGYAYCRMIFENGEPQDFVYLVVNAAFETLTGLRNVVGRRVTEVIPGIRQTDPDLFTIYGRVSLSGTPEKFEMFVRALNLWFSVSVHSPGEGCFVAVFDDITARKTAEETLRVKDWAIESAISAIVTSDMGGNLTYVNPAFLDLWGYPTRAEVLGKPVVGFWRAGQTAAAMIEAVRTQGSWTGDLVAQRKDGRLFDVHAASSLVVNDAGRPVCMLGSFADITVRKRADDALHENEARRTAFLATLSHELRTPLAPIRYALELLDRVNVSIGRSQPKDVIARQVSHLVYLIDDLLDATRIVSNKVRLRRQRVELAALVQQAVEAASPDIDRANHTLVVAPPPEAVWLDVDPQRFVQILTNLLNNAARFTPRAGQIVVAAEPDGEDPDEIVVSVSDTGIGMRPEDLTSVFEMFRQVGEPGHGGLGIGLALVKGLVELHGGRVEARSRGLGLGSEFLVRLRRAAAPGAEADNGAPPHSAKVARRILVVDDDEDTGDMMRALLELDGHAVRVARDGRSALELAAAFDPELFLVDIGLPDMDGCELARRWREDPVTRNRVLVAVTGWGQEEDRARVRRAGFDAHLTKPADPEAIARLIQDTLKTTG
jgi:PAS domain S-box-containing protein